MKALILAAGLATRLRPLTDDLPKILLTFAEQPLLKYHLDSLTKYGIDQVLINTHYLSDKVEKYLKQYRKTNDRLVIKTTYEESLLGSAGTLKLNGSFFSSDDFLVIYGDNLTNINYQNLITYHLEKEGICTIASYFEKYPETKGIISFDESKKINQFVEKPARSQITSNFANAGIYVFQPKILSYLEKLKMTPLDFGFDLFPFLLKTEEKMYLYPMSEFLLDIGTPESYHLAQAEIKKITI
jgi:mannose-1-phosphate guanylyltransferase